jgi:glycine dehydrogenase subunit 2
MTTEVTGYHAHRWREPLIMGQGRSGERGITFGAVEKEIASSVGSAESVIPQSMRRKGELKLPEIAQPHVLRHYLRLSQETMGMALNVDFGQGTCTMKYSPIVNENLVELPEVRDVHPCQDEETIQGTLEIAYKFGRMLSEISGLDEFTFQPAGGAHGVYTDACLIRRHHELNGELKQRNEMITTLFSHPCDAGTPASAGFKVITLYPDEETGLPDVEALKAAVSKRTAGLMITNPEDTGIFNPHIDEFTKIVHEVGGLCAYDQANANPLLGIARAKEAGFDMGQFNLHKTFSSPHCSVGPACGAVGVKKELAGLLPVPVVIHDGGRYRLEYNRPRSIGKVRAFMGNLQIVVRAYAWVMSLGYEGLRQVSETSIVNTNYMLKGLLKIRGVTLGYPKQRIRLDQARFSLQRLKDATGVGTEDVERRMGDYGVSDYFTSHHPWVVPEPFLPEPCETYSKSDIDRWVAIVAKICREAHADPELVKTSPHSQPGPMVRTKDLNDPKKWATTWREYVRKNERPKKR